MDARRRRTGAGGLGKWLARVAPRSAAGEVTVMLVTDRRMKALNARFRGADCTTDVLSFPLSDGKRPEPGFHQPGRAKKRDGPVLPLGDIVIATGVATRQAREHGHPYAIELRVLALHGLLHLLGHDHDSPRDRGRMARVERRLRRKGALPAGLIGRRP